jgi:hypothetical protein
MRAYSRALELEADAASLRPRGWSLDGKSLFPLSNGSPRTRGDRPGCSASYGGDRTASPRTRGWGPPEEKIRWLEAEGSVAPAIRP